MIPRRATPTWQLFSKTWLKSPIKCPITRRPGASCLARFASRERKRWLSGSRRESSSSNSTLLNNWRPMHVQQSGHDRNGGFDVFLFRRPTSGAGGRKEIGRRCPAGDFAARVEKSGSRSQRTSLHFSIDDRR